MSFKGKLSHLNEIVMLEDKINGLLKRREVNCTFKGYAGKLTRKEAVEKVVKELKLDNKFVIPVSLMCNTGINDIKCTFYVYDEETLARIHLPKHLFKRMLTKEESKEKNVEKDRGKAPDSPPKEVKIPEEKAKEVNELVVTGGKNEDAKIEELSKEVGGKDKPEEEVK